jgi:hypothetical protein
MSVTQQNSPIFTLAHVMSFLSIIGMGFGAFLILSVDVATVRSDHDRDRVAIDQRLGRMESQLDVIQASLRGPESSEGRRR